MPTWRQQIVVTILIIIAKMFCDDEELRKEIHHVGVSVRAKPTGGR